jgi:hypothetical protein
MTSSIVQKTEFGSASAFVRMDAEFVDPLSLAAEKAVAKQPSIRLGAVVDVTSDCSMKVAADEDVEVRYIAIDNVDTDDGLCFENTLLVADLPSRAKYLVQENDILVSNVRPDRGAIALVSERTAGAIASSGFTLVRRQPSAALSVPYLFACLRTKYARAQLNRRTRNSMYPAVTESDVLQLVLPKPTAGLEASVKKLVARALTEQEAFYAAHRELGALLESFLKGYRRPPSPVGASGREPHITRIKATDVFGPNGAHRVDAEFFRREYALSDADMQKRGSSFLLGEHFDLSPGRALGPGEHYSPYVKQGVLTNVGVNWSALAYEEGTPGPPSSRVRTGDILLACTAHEIFYIGRKVDFVREVPKDIRDENTCVPDLMIIRPKPTKPAYLYGSYVAAFLRHDNGRHQVQRCIRGLRGGHVYRDDLSRFVRVPFPPKAWLHKFEEIAARAEANRNDAKATITRAVGAVEQYVRNIVA